MAAVVDDLLAAGPLTHAEQRRLAHAEVSAEDGRVELGQYFTPAPIARLLADMFEAPEGRVRVLDPGAGVGSLSAALVERAANEGWQCSVDVTAVEIDDRLLAGLESTLHDCRDVMQTAESHVEHADFLAWGASRVAPEMFQQDRQSFDLIIMNPPYGKLRTAGITTRRTTRRTRVRQYDVSQFISSVMLDSPRGIQTIQTVRPTVVRPSTKSAPSRGR